MRVDVVDLLRVQPGVLERHLHAARGPFAAGCRRGHVVRVGRVAVAKQLAIDACAPRFGMFEFFQHDHRRALAHHEAIAAEVEGSGRPLRLVIPRAHGLHCAKTANAQRHDRGLGATGEHHLRVAHLERAPGLANGVCRSRAGGTRGDVRPAQLVVHREQTGGHVQDERRDHERRDAARTFRQQYLVLFLGRVQSADAGADEDTDLIAVDRFKVEAGIKQRLVTGMHAEVDEPVHAPDILCVGKRRSRIKIPHLAGDPAVVGARVEVGDRADAAAAGDDLVKAGVGVVAERRNRAQSGDDHADVVMIAGHIKTKGQPGHTRPCCPGKRRRIISWFLRCSGSRHRR